MGFNTTIVVLNDALGAIAADRDFGATLAQAIKTSCMNPFPPNEIEVNCVSHKGESK